MVNLSSIGDSVLWGLDASFYAGSVTCVIASSNSIHQLTRTQSLLIDGIRIGHVRYINILPWLRGFQVILGVVFFVYKSLLGIERQKKLKNLQFWPESLGAMLEYRYIERGLLFTLDRQRLGTSQIDLPALAVWWRNKKMHGDKYLLRSRFYARHAALRDEPKNGCEGD